MYSLTTTHTGVSRRLKMHQVYRQCVLFHALLHVYSHTLHTSMICIFSHPIHQRKQGTRDTPTVTLMCLSPSTTICIFAHPTYLSYVCSRTLYTGASRRLDTNQVNVNGLASKHYHMYIRTPYIPFICIL